MNEMKCKEAKHIFMPRIFPDFFFSEASVELVKLVNIENAILGSGHIVATLAIRIKPHATMSGEVGGYA